MRHKQSNFAKRLILIAWKRDIFMIKKSLRMSIKRKLKT